MPSKTRGSPKITIEALSGKILSNKYTNVSAKRNPRYK
jgi:hypothetical protein